MHRANTVIAAVGVGHPLAYGLERLRAAFRTATTDLNTLKDQLPEDRSEQLRRAESNLQHHQQQLDHARKQLHKAEQELDAAGQRHWGRRDKPRIDAAQKRLRSAGGDVRTLTDRVASAAANLASEADHAQQRHQALDASKPQRQHFSAARSLLGHGIDQAREERVIEAATASPGSHHLHELLGPPPTSRGGLGAWCALADRYEIVGDGRPIDELPGAFQYLAYRMHPRSVDTIGELNAVALTVIARAEAADPQPAVGIPDHQARRQAVDMANTAQQLHEQHAARTLEHGIDRGMSLGL